MTSIREIEPRIPDHIERMVAEVLACCDTNPEKRRAHRIQKLSTFPEADRDRVRDITNRVIQARNRSKAA